MTIVLELRPDQEQYLQTAAAAQGLSVEAYLVNLALQHSPIAPAVSQDDPEEWARNFREALKRLKPAAYAPPLSELKREYAYEDPE